MALTVLVILIIYLTRISEIDIERREISNCAPIIIIMASPFITQLSFADRFIGLLAIFIPLLILNILLDIGMGDVKLAAAFGFALGAVPEYIALLFAMLAAFIVNKLKKYENGIPLAPYICTANLVLYFIGGFYNA